MPPKNVLWAVSDGMAFTKPKIGALLVIRSTSNFQKLFVSKLN